MDRSVASNAHPRASVVVPAFNESALIAEGLDRLDAYLSSIRPKYDCELIVVDDGSTDGTPAILEAWASAHPGRLTVVAHARNAGLVAAIRTGCAAATQPTIVIMDADLSYGPQTIGALLEARAAVGAAAAVASPYMPGGRTANVPFMRLAASRVANLLLSACTFGRVKTFTGMVRAYDAATLHPILAEPERGEFNAWIIAQLLNRGERIVEIPAALIWPKTRSEAPSRLSVAQFRSRIQLTLVSAVTMLKLSTFPRGKGHKNRPIGPF